MDEHRNGKGKKQDWAEKEVELQYSPNGGDSKGVPEEEQSFSVVLSSVRMASTFYPCVACGPPQKMCDLG